MLHKSTGDFQTFYIEVIWSDLSWVWVHGYVYRGCNTETLRTCLIKSNGRSYWCFALSRSFLRTANMQSDITRRIKRAVYSWAWHFVAMRSLFKWIHGPCTLRFISMTGGVLTSQTVVLRHCQVCGVRTSASSPFIIPFCVLIKHRREWPACSCTLGISYLSFICVTDSRI